MRTNAPENSASLSDGSLPNSSGASILSLFVSSLLFYFAYVLAGGLSQGMKIIPGVSITFWPSAGIFVAMLLVSERRHWPLFVVIGLAAELSCNFIWFHDSLAPAIGYYAANALEALVAAALVRYASRKSFRFESFEDVGLFVTLGAGVAPMVGATVIAMIDTALGKHPFFTAWPLVWLGDASGLLVSTPLTFVVMDAWRERRRVTWIRLLEASVLLTVILVLGVLAFRRVLPTPYVLMPAMFWAAVRFQLKGAAAVVAYVTLLSAAFAMYDRIEFQHDPQWLLKHAIGLQTFLATAAVSTLVVSVLSLQYHDALRSLRIANSELERRVEERTATLAESEERLRLAVEATGVGIFDFDFVSNRHAMNGQARELIGISADDIPTPELLLQAVHPEDLERVSQAVEQCLHSSEQGQLALEFRLAPALGANRWLALSAQMRLAESPRRPMRVVGTVFDITTRKQAESALREREETLRLFIDNAPAAIAMFDREMRYLSASRRWKSDYGLGETNLVGRYHYDILPHLPVEWKDAHRRSLAGEVLNSPGDQYTRADGTSLWVKWETTPWYKSANEIGGILVYAEDITERKLSEQALQDRDLQLRMAVQASLSIVFVWEIEADRVHRLLSEESSLPETHRQPVRFADVVAAVHPEDCNVFQATVREAMNSKSGDYRSEFRVVRPTGEVRWLYENGRVEFDATGRPFRLIGISTDITERKQAEEQARRQRRLTEAVIELTPACVAVTRGDELRFELVNPAFQSLYPDRVIAGRTVPEIWPEIADSFAERFRKVLATGDPYLAADEPFEFEVENGQPKRRYLSWSIHRVELPPSDRGLLVTGWETTSRVLVEQALREADRRKNEFLATLSHELRNPLAPLRTAVDLLQLRLPPQSDLQRAREVIDRQTSAMTRLIDDLMDLSRITRGRIELRRAPMRLSQAIDAALEATRPLMAEMGHALTVRLPSEPLWVDGDSTRLTQVVLNLLNNAAKYTEPGGQIELSVTGRDDRAVITVRDTGIGIPADKLSHVFDMFSQVEETLNRSRGGLGIGLCVVKQLVEMHGGSVSVASEGAGRGSEFVVELPTIAAQSEGIDSAPTESPNHAAVTQRVLVVDDNVDAANTLGLLFRISGSTVRMAYDGEEALDALREFQPAVVLCDLGMPKMNGYEFCRRVRAEVDGQSPLMIALSGWGQTSDRERSRAAGFDHHLVKPTDIATIHQILAELRERRATTD